MARFKRRESDTHAIDAQTKNAAREERFMMQVSGEEAHFHFSPPTLGDMLFRIKKILPGNSNHVFLSRRPNLIPVLIEFEALPNLKSRKRRIIESNRCFRDCRFPDYFKRAKIFA